MIKLLLKTSLPFIICISIFVFSGVFCFLNYSNNITNDLSSLKNITVTADNNQKSSTSFDHITSALSSDKKKKETNDKSSYDKSSSKEIKKLLHTTNKCIRSKFLSIK